MSLVEQVSALVRERAGLQLDTVMRTRLVRALEDARRQGEDDPSLLLRLRSDPSARQWLYDELTVQETSFFRDPAQFAGLAETVLPSLPDPVVLWSAGCSNGQEAWSLAMVLAEQGRSGQVVATDLSERALARTREGRYAEREMRGLSAERRDRWFVKQGNGPGATYTVVPALRRLVRVDRHNLATDLAPLPQASVVFCRNVLIYFGRADVAAAVRRFHEVLAGDGWLFLGFSETLWTLSEAFVPVRMGEAYAYRPAGAPPRPGRSAEPRAVRRALPTVPVLDDLRGSGPGSPATPRTAFTRVGESSDVAVLLAQGERALRSGLAADAVSAFRGAAYLAPDLPLPHLELGLALYALGEKAAARRALQTARRVLGGSTGDVAGWDAAVLRRWIDERLAAVEADA